MLINQAAVAADLVVLAINTAKVTSAEEHIANAMYAAYNRLFTHVNTNGTDIKPGIASANAIFALKPVNAAVAGTYSTQL